MKVPKFSEWEMAGLLNQVDDGPSAGNLASDLASMAQEVRHLVGDLRGMFRISLRKSLP